MKPLDQPLQPLDRQLQRRVLIERLCLGGHVGAMLFGLAGLLLVMPHPEFIMALPEFGQQAFQLSLGNGGVVYMILATIAISLYAQRTVGTDRWLKFMVPSIVLSLTSELLGTSTGFPFGHYRYLSGLGYKIAGLVPFTIPLSWFYLGFSAYVLAAAGLSGLARRRGLAVGLTGSWLMVAASIGLGSMMLTAWDFVLDPAMSQAPVKFWEFMDAGEFFGMPYRNISGWLATGAIYMGVSSLFWGKEPLVLNRQQLWVPLVLYIVNFAFGAAITLTQLPQGFWLPASIAVLFGIVPAVALWWMAGSPEEPIEGDASVVVVAEAIVK
jgi:uncharacterized membrane protein